MRSSTVGVLGAAVLAGLIAGAITSAFHFVLAEPVIERAIEQEKQTKIAYGANAEAPIVSRTVQRIGLVVGLLIYGAVWGALFGVAYLLLEGRRPRVRGWLLAIVLGWAVAWFPFLKYPANPPGVGESATVVHRQFLYVGFIVLSAAGAAIARFVHARGVPGGVRSVVILYAVYAVALYLATPVNPDQVRMPAALVWTFRATSLAGLMVFWLALGTSFQWLARARA